METEKQQVMADMVYKKCRERNNPFAENVLKMIEANWTNEQIIEKLIDNSGDLFDKFSKVVAAFPAQNWSNKILEKKENI